MRCAVCTNQTCFTESPGLNFQDIPLKSSSWPFARVPARKLLVKNNSPENKFEYTGMQSF